MESARDHARSPCHRMLPTGADKVNTVLRMARRTRLVCLLVMAFLSAACARGGTEAVSTSAPLDTVPYGTLVTGSVGGRDAYAADVRAIPGFAGVYTDGCNVVVLLTPPVTRGVAAAARRYADQLPVSYRGRPCSGAVTPREARYGWADLSRWYHQRLRLDTGTDVTVHALNMVRNRIVVGVRSEQARRAVEKEVERSGVPRGAVLIAYTPRLPDPPAEYSVVVEVAELSTLKPVADVDVRVRARGGRETAARSPASGRVQVALPERGWYAIEIAVPAGYTLADPRSNPRWIELYRADEPRIVGFRLVPTRTGSDSVSSPPRR